MKLAAGLIFFNDRESLQRCLDSLPGVDIIFAIDGRFPDYDYPSDLSDDGSRDVVKSFANTMLIDCPAPEVTKRNRYLELCQEHGVTHLLIIDSDEYVLDADWPAFRDNLARLTSHTNYFGISSRPGLSVDFSTYPRLWQHPEQIEYDQCHNFFRNKISGLVVRSPNHAPLVKGIRMAWDDKLRKPDHLQKSYDYQVKLIEKEKRINQELERE